MDFGFGLAFGLEFELRFNVFYIIEILNIYIIILLKDMTEIEW